MTEQEQIAAFLASRGATKIAEGATCGADAREWRRAVRSPSRVSMSEEDRLIRERHYVVGADGIEHCRNGLGEWIY